MVVQVREWYDSDVKFDVRMCEKITYRRVLTETTPPREQKYLENPMTLKPFNRKFDMRTWVLVTSKFECVCECV